MAATERPTAAAMQWPKAGGRRHGITPMEWLGVERSSLEGSRATSQLVRNTQTGNYKF
ncbi:hypothetical protein [Siphonobacter sp.]|uniref:hypothetical protein n=1 Tax=Siphonobacter sp. TaxID=1869184 RepID=UPI003B3BC3DF